MKFNTDLSTEEDILNVDVEFDYQPEERGDLEYPGMAAEVTITSVICDGAEMVDVLTPSELNKLTEESFEFIANYDKENY